MILLGGHHFLVAILALQYAQLTFAFNPSYLFVAGLPYEGLRKILQQDPTRGLFGRPHAGITQDAINQLYPVYFNIDKPTSTMKKARREIEVGTEKVDDHSDELEEAEKSECHFDDENFNASNTRLIDKKTEVADFLAKNDVSSAREHLGRALHTLQDFYSHSNWVELGNTEADQISQNLGVTWPLDIPVVAENPESDTTRTCTACQYTLTTREDAILGADTCRTLGRFPLDDPLGPLGKAITAFCMLGITSPASPALQAALLLSGLAMPVITPLEWPTCRANLLPLGGRLTSGWFGALPETHATRKDGKCSHGGPFDRDADGLEGISKDTAIPFLTPHWFNHYTAARLAEAATVKYLNELAEMICKDPSGGAIAYEDCVPLRKLYGVGPPLAFVIDTTGSMGSVIASVRRDAIAMVQSRIDSENLPGYFVLSEIQDPSPPAASIYYDAGDFIAAISRLGAFGGGDCPEYAMTGVLNALELMGPGGTIHLWTDAAAKDAALSGTVIDQLYESGTAVYSYLFRTGGCSTSATFDLVSKGSGGQFFPGLSSSDAAGTSTLVNSLSLEDRVNIWLISVGDFFSFSKRQADSSGFTYDIPVDSAMTTLSISVSGTSLTVTLLRPDESVVAAGDADVVIANLATGTIYSISKPVAGMWKLSITASTGFSMSAFGTSTLQFDRFDFLEYASGHHDGFFPVNTPPRIGESALGYSVLDGDFASTDFELRALDGSLLRKVDVTGGSDVEGDLPANHFYGSFPIPSTGFNIYVTGKDSAGASYQRVLPGIVKPTASNSTNSTLPSNTTVTSTSRATLNTTSLSFYPTASIVYPTASSGKLYPYPSANSTYALAASTYSRSHSSQIVATESAVPTLTQTVIYHSSCPIEKGSTTSYSIATITTTIAVPCYTKCHEPLPILSPGCKFGNIEHHAHPTAVHLSSTVYGSSPISLGSAPSSSAANSVYTDSLHANSLYTNSLHTKSYHSNSLDSDSVAPHSTSQPHSPSSTPSITPNAPSSTTPIVHSSAVPVPPYPISDVATPNTTVSDAAKPTPSGTISGISPAGNSTVVSLFTGHARRLNGAVGMHVGAVIAIAVVAGGVGLV